MANERPPQNILNEIFSNASFRDKAELDYIQIKISELITIRLNIQGDDRKNFWRDFMTVLKRKNKTNESAGQNYAYDVLAKAYFTKKGRSQGGKNKNHTTNEEQTL